MIHIITTTLALVVALSLPVSAISAEKHGGDIWFKDTKKFAPAIFSHDKHSQAGNQCTDCHDSLFQKESGSSDLNKALSMRSMTRGKFCGACHDGKKAFSVKRSCKKCHVKP
ncbi:MAG: hypothetical protein HOJ79_01870 [Nitrospina sp.]|nr:hypothetical protein [Nitrospina sp.]